MLNQLDKRISMLLLAKETIVLITFRKSNQELKKCAKNSVSNTRLRPTKGEYMSI